MMLFWLLGLLLALVVAVFASHNPLMVDINFFGWAMERVALSVVILVSAFMGALISFFFSGIKQLSMGRELKKARKSQEEASKREMQHMEEIKELQVAKERALVEAERNATGDIRAYQDDLRAKDEQINQLQEQLEQLAFRHDGQGEQKPAEAAKPDDESSQSGEESRETEKSSPDSGESSSAEEDKELNTAEETEETKKQ